MYGESTSATGLRRSASPGVRWLFLVTILAFVIQHLLDFRTQGGVTRTLGLSREGFLGHAQLWQAVTYMFLHGGYDGPSRFLMLPFLHIAMNMFVLLMFGGEIERYLGTERFLGFYLGCGAVAGLGWLMVSGGGGLDVAGYGGPVCIGASGAVCGIVAAYAALYPNREVMLLFLPIRLSMRTMILVLGAVTVFLMLFDMLGEHGGDVAHAAHLAGGLVGYFFAHRAKPALRVVAEPEMPTWKAAQWSDTPEGDGLLRTEEPPETPDPQEIDAILEKIKEKGIGSLSRKERRVLEDASQQSDEY